MTTDNQKSRQSDNADIAAWLQIWLTPKIGPATFHKLLYHFGTVQNILKQEIKLLEKFVQPIIASMLVNGESLDKVNTSLHWLEQSNDHYIITLNDEIYPKELRTISDPPPILFAQGNIDLLSKNKFAVVGTRHPTTQGKEHAVKFAYELGYNGFSVVSGMASGIDRHAHIGGLKTKSSTIAVLGCGIDICYPKSNLDLYQQIATNGLLISEFPLATPAIAGNFPRRNRIVVGMAFGCLVVESAIDGGSMISANLALEMGREVMAIPGSIHNPATKGCHKLIKQGAKLIENINDILEELKHPIQHRPITSNSTMKDEHPILKSMGFEPIDIDTICNNLELPFNTICAQILELELSGKISNCGNGIYIRVRN